MFKQVLLLALAVASVSANLNFTNCGSTSHIIAFRLTGCDAAPCRIQRGHSYHGELDIVSAVPTNTLPLLGQVNLGHPYPPVTLVSGDACDSLRHGACPIHVGGHFTATLDFHIPAAIPTVTTSFFVSMADGIGQIHACATILVSLQ